MKPQIGFGWTQACTLVQKEDFTLQNMETNWTWTEPVPSSCSKVEVVQSSRSRNENLTSKNSANIVVIVIRASDKVSAQSLRDSLDKSNGKPP